jgi:hypothetical protein
MRETQEKKYTVYEDRISEYTKNINKLELNYEELKEAKTKLDERFEKYQEDTTNEINTMIDDNKKEKETDTRKIRDLEK